MAHEETPTYAAMLATEVERVRVAELVALAGEFYPEPIEDVFVSEYKEEDGRLVIQSVWMFTTSFAIEFKNPLQEDNFDLACIKDSISWMVVEKRDFDFHTTSAESRLKVKFRFATGLSGTLQATGDNCAQLYRITRDRILANTLKHPPSAVIEESL
jgi:hypothetical protein